MPRRACSNMMRNCSFAAIAGALLATAAASAGLSDDILTIEATSDRGTGSLVIHFADGAFDAADHKFTYTLGSATPITSAATGETICTLRAAEITIRKYARHNANFTIDSADGATRISVRSGLASFPQISADAAVAVASVSLGLSDVNNDGSSLAVVGGESDGIFRALFNGRAPASGVYSRQLSGVSGGAGGTISVSQKDPIAGTRAIGTAVSDMSYEFIASVGAGDRVEVAISYRIQPDPTCIDDSDGDGVLDCDEVPVASTAATTGTAADANTAGTDSTRDLAGDTNGDSATPGSTSVCPAAAPAATLASFAALMAMRRPMRRR